MSQGPDLLTTLLQGPDPLTTVLFSATILALLILTVGVSSPPTTTPFHAASMSHCIQGLLKQEYQRFTLSRAGTCKSSEASQISSGQLRALLTSTTVFRKPVRLMHILRSP